MRSLLQIIALTTLSLSLGVAGAPAPESEKALMKRDPPSWETKGFDVSDVNGYIDWYNQARAKGSQFAYIRATAGTTYNDFYFHQNWNDVVNNGIIPGAYHQAVPESSYESGVTQARFFVDNGGAWYRNNPDILPGAIKLEGENCADISQQEMVDFIMSFSITYETETTRYPVIYTSTSWWAKCTGNSAIFGSNPLWIANLQGSGDPLPASWSYYTFWQYAYEGVFPGNQDSFNGNHNALTEFASGS